MIRPFELTDLLTLNRLRKRGTYLDNRAALTWGTRIITLRALVSPVSGAAGIFTGVYNHSQSGLPLIGQASHISGRATARLSFLAPDELIELPAVEELVEYLLKKLGERETQTLLAEVDESSAAFEVLHKLNFSIYARQQIWRISYPPKTNRTKSNWRMCSSLDGFNIRKLYLATVPTLVQQIESKDFSELNGWVYYRDNDLLGFVEIAAGPCGLWAQLFFHPEMEHVEEHLANLLVHLRPHPRRPIYLCLRRYQRNLIPFLSEIDAETSSRQAVMARRLAARVTHAELAPIPKINGTSEATTNFNDIRDLPG